MYGYCKMIIELTRHMKHTIYREAMHAKYNQTNAQQCMYTKYRHCSSPQLYHISLPGFSKPIGRMNHGASLSVGQNGAMRWFTSTDGLGATLS